MLKIMARKYSREHYLELVRKIKEAIPDAVLTTDIIVGFPNETDEQFEETMSLYREVGFDTAFTFIYSPRVGTRAAAMENQIRPQVATERIQRLIALQEGLQQETLKRFVGMEEEVLIEGLSRRSSEEISGKGLHGVSITMQGKREEIGRIIRCRVTGVKNNTLTGVRE